MSTKISSQEGKAVLVTGATSTLGFLLIEQLLKDPKIRFVYAAGADTCPETFKRYATNRFYYQTVNFLKTRQIKNLFRSDIFFEQKIDTIVHLAFLHRPEFTGRDTHALNIHGTKNLLEGAIESDSVTQFVFRSSGMVYHVHSRNPIELDENADLNFEPMTHPIIQDEVNAEMLCQAKLDNDSVDIIILRPTALVGRQVHSYFNAYLDGAIHPKIMGYNPVINLLDIRDMERAVRMALHTNNIKGVFNIVGKDTLTLADASRLAGGRQISIPERYIVRVCRTLRNLDLTDFHAGVAVERLKYSCLLDGRKAADQLNYIPEHQLSFQ